MGGPTRVDRYPDLAKSGDLARRAHTAHQCLRDCQLCPHRCGVDRLVGALGICGAGADARMASFGPHFGEESPLVGRRGSGTVFFAWCNMRCCYCQNADISHAGCGDDISCEELARVFLQIQQAGCANLNLVSPTQFTSQILAALDIAAREGLELPLVWNTGGYECTETLKLLDGVVDIYMPDIKYSSDETAQLLSGTPQYSAHAFAAVMEMHRQVGDLVVDDEGLARRGLLVRHLVLPNDLSGTERIMRFLANHVSVHTYVNIMDQYRPCHRALNHPELSRRITTDELRAALVAARAEGLYRFAE